MGFVIILLEKLLSHEEDKTVALQIKLQLFWANYKLEGSKKQFA